MPVVFRERGFRFFFYSFEGSPREPVHIHVKGNDADAKFWVGEEIVLAYNDGLNSRDLALVSLIIRARRKEIRDAWYAHFG
ncbi:MAG: hypothetical protein B7Y43_13605 [Sphingomonas sp. 28-62-20]|uniref:DUF4160 domain-containing protein n=1 Tax=unclassified Sphingomonas TaxID=196159 RepID=UPI000A0E754B|nr:DUF4160 domain-containing protein [Sphingomonas sp.]OQW78410.1 MAG: hypothetical protein BVN33_00760 [Proteobacteria bacterium ST_bin13]OYY76788.1 MAG: hypothetical protein B7Y43_13605 [Sphingomonas sp. 28-62-20]